MRERSTKLGRLVSHALRHEPWLYELELDDQGWADLEALLAAIRGLSNEWTGLSLEEFKTIIENADKRRHEICNGRIRALYGHSVPGRLSRTPSPPPPVLFHGTSPELEWKIQHEGLKPMQRQYVHLSVDRATAYAVGKRKSSHPVVLVIDASAASRAGELFYAGNDRVWLTSRVLPEFIACEQEFGRP